MVKQEARTDVLFDLVDRVARIETESIAKKKKIDQIATLDNRMMYDELVRVKENIKRQQSNLTTVKGDLKRNFQQLSMAIQQSFQNYSRNQQILNRDTKDNLN